MPASSALPFAFALASGEPYAFAGLWESWCPKDGAPLETFTILTTDPNQLMEPIHNRMPAILAPDRIKSWLRPGDISPEDYAAHCVPYPASELQAFSVSTLVNSPRHDSPDCVVPTLPPTPGKPVPTDPGLFG